MGFIRTNYISEVVVDELARRGGVARVVQQAERRNPVAGITGALIFTGVHFAQALEGQAEVVANLMQRIRGDARHRIVLEFGYDAIDARRFDVWALAYTGPSIYIARIVAQVLFEAPDRPGPAKRDLLELLFEFSTK